MNNYNNRNSKTYQLPTIKIRPYQSDRSNTVAFVDLTFYNGFVVTGVTVVRAPNTGNLFVAMPSAKKKDGSYKDITFPITAEYRELLYKAILNEYNSAMENDDLPM